MTRGSRRRVLGGIVGSLLAVSVPSSILASDWTRFRGPNGSGVSPDAAETPTQFSASENLKWKCELPGPGSSCPIVVGDRIFVTSWSGYGTPEKPNANPEDLRRHLICIDRKTGRVVWDVSEEAVLPEDEYGGMFAEHGYASHTPVSDGKRVYAYFGKTGAVAYDMEGKKLWQTKTGSELDPRRWGSASSPILHKNLVIITSTAESEAVVALDQETGKEVWRQEAKGFNSCWGTPVLVDADGGRTDLVIGVPNEIWGLDPDTGKLRWYCLAMETDSFCSSVVADKGIVYAVEGRGGGSIAIRAGGKGELKSDQIVWSGNHSNRIGTPLVHDGHLYFFGNRVANCVRCSDGELVYQERMTGGQESGRGPGGGNPPGGRPDGGRPEGGRPDGGRRGGFGGGGMGGDYASPILAGGKLYFTSRSGDIYVIKAGSRFELLAVNRLTDEREDFSATPAASDGELFFRSSRNLYCVGSR